MNNNNNIDNNNNNNNDNNNNNNMQRDCVPKIFANKTDNTCLCLVVQFSQP